MRNMWCGLVSLAAIFCLTASAETNPRLAHSSVEEIPARAAARLLDQATWGPTALAIAELQHLGIDRWLEVQIGAEPSDIPDQPILNSAGKTNTSMAPVQAAFFQNAVTGRDQLRQRVAFALSQIWVVSTTGLNAAYAYPPYWRIFRDNAFGNYRDVIRQMTLSPAMGFYLNMANNNKGNAAKNTSANENYARELMQLFTLGLTQKNLDGTAVLDQNQHPVATYDQTAVTNLAKVVTGWTYPTQPAATPKSNNPQYYFGQMIAVEANHDTSAKTIFGGITIPAGQTAERDIESMLDALMAQPTMAPFVSQQLIQHLVTSNPSPQYIARVSKVFEDDGQGAKGNLKAVITAILKDPEARAADDPAAAVSANFGHLREPVLFLASLLRGLNATLASNSNIYSYSSQLGQNLFGAPSVFSYFSPQYRIQGGLLAPEFQIYSTQTAAYRADVVTNILYSTIDKGTKVNLTSFVSEAGIGDSSLLNYISLNLLHGSMPAALEIAATDAMNGATTATGKAQAALQIVLTSSEYQIIH